jgi:biotin carboxyl carrier protein
MRKYNVNVNGTAYEVTVEEIQGGAAAPVSAPAPAAAPAPAPAPAPAAAGAGEPVNAPMPGTILDVKVTAGQAVKSGDVLMILEAMKMENEIMAPKDGTVTSVSASKGASVQSGDVLCTIA